MSRFTGACALACVFVFSAGSARAEGNARLVLRDLERLQVAVERHQATTGERPRDRNTLGVAARLYAPGVAQSGGVPVDAWGTPYHYEPNATADAAHIYSHGANRSDDGGTGDDLVDATSASREHYPELLVAQRRALQLFPLLLLFALAPIAWAAIRWSRR
ncbi:MAG: type II secretion system protein GspG [Myxococcota bacterium]